MLAAAADAAAAAAADAAADADDDAGKDSFRTFGVGGHLGADDKYY